MTARAFASNIVVGQTHQLARDESHYLTRVRRCRVGDTIELLDGERHGFLGRIETLGDGVMVTISAQLPDQVLPPLTLALATIDTPALLDALAAACELGATTVQLVQTTFSQSHVPSLTRSIRTLRASMRQCGRAVPPTLGLVAMPLEAFLAQDHPPSRWLADAGAPPYLPQLETPTAATVVAVGPEGGFTPLEHEGLLSTGFAPLCLGPFVLRAERAVVAALTAVTLARCPS